MKTMNKIKSVIVVATILFTSVLTSSCSSDDDGDSPSIVGTWLQISGSSEAIKNGVSEGVQNDIVDADNFTRVTFNSDETFSDLYSEFYNGQVETSTYSGTYTIDGDIISVSYDGETEVYESTFSLTDNQLIVYDTEEYMSNGDTYIYNYITTFARQ